MTERFTDVIDRAIAEKERELLEQDYATPCLVCGGVVFEWWESDTCRDCEDVDETTSEQTTLIAATDGGERPRATGHWTDQSDEYAEAIRDGLNSFLEHSEIAFEYAIDHAEEGATQITFSPEQTTVETDDGHEYSVDDAGEQLNFRFDGESLSIAGDVDDWSVFNYQRHTGEAVSCIIESGRNIRAVDEGTEQDGDSL